MKAPLILAAILTVSQLLQDSNAASHEDYLVAKLLESLQPVAKIARPVPDAGNAVTVNLGLELQRILSVKRNAAKLDVWLTMTWTDPRLRWNPALYGGVGSLVLPADLLWLPDIRPFTTLDYQPRMDIASRVTVDSNGTVMYVLPVRLRIDACQKHNNGSVACMLKLGSWAYNGNQLDIRLIEDAAFSLTTFVPDDWKVVSADASRSEVFYDCCPGPFVSVFYKMLLTPMKLAKAAEKKASKSRRKPKAESKRRSKRCEF